MNNREITSLMHRLFYGDLGPADYVHFMVDEKLDRIRVNSLLGRFIPGDEFLIYANSSHCALSSRSGAFEHSDRLMQLGRVKIADPRFEGRVIIEPSGVGAGQRVTDR
ncbi:hypothetical protein ACQV5M_18970 [Leptospira sp. SA-E8]|uniref:hypothetical protein n=1 Tax=Leptospira sp. SA-E8 TaxID=3422259 RepID=UPI003EBA6A35